MMTKESFGILCSKLGVELHCPYCKRTNIIKSGKSNNNKQRYKCKDCHKRFINQYDYQAYLPDVNEQIITLTKEGLGIRSTARVLKISTTTLIRRIIAISKTINQPAIHTGKSYEVDEMRIFIGKKSCLRWIVYALERESKAVVSFNVGRRTNKTLKTVIKSLEHSRAKKIYTDKLINYQYIINRAQHNTNHRKTNHIERNNLTMRIHLKRLNRKTLCFSKSILVLFSILRIYFWG